jgi:hypothetical protein
MVAGFSAENRLGQILRSYLCRRKHTPVAGRLVKIAVLRLSIETACLTAPFFISKSP